MSQVLPVITALGSIGTLLGLIAVLYALQRNHDWYRRQYALDIMKGWNATVLPHVREIERICPGLFDLDKQQQAPTELTKQRAIDIYTATVQNADCWNVRHHIAELLNFCEFVTTAYIHKVADEEIVKHSLQQSLIRVSDALKNYLEVVKTRRGYQPWQPFLDVISLWSAKKGYTRPPTG